uniref:Uncharacterized protein n=1 Tax=Nelumbo nucifera TaxID=4432 RepID=A0A823A020_NELNU|nr:TPA_asm: hypothetical protein HUJ06_018626 [Nelumbo nucifera]
MEGIVESFRNAWRKRLEENTEQDCEQGDLQPVLPQIDVGGTQALTGTEICSRNEELSLDKCWFRLCLLDGRLS